MKNSDDQVSIGEELRRERTVREVSLEDISRETKISVANLEALERNELEKLPGGIYTLNFIKAYVKYLGLSEEKILNSYYYQISGQTTTKDQKKKALGSGKSRRRLFPFLVVIILAGVLAVYLLMSQVYRSEGDVERSSPENGGLLKKEEKRTVKGNPEALGTYSPGGVEGYRKEPAEEERISGREAPEGEKVEPLKFEFLIKKKCWLTVYSDDELEVTGHVTEGEAKTLYAYQKVKISVDNPAAVSMKINGKSAHSLGKEGERIHELIISRDNLSSFLPLERRPEAL